MIEKFLLYAQLELSAADPRRSEAAAARPPNETADTIIAAAERAAHASRRSGDLRLEASPVAHRIEASHLARLVQELLENAFKFSDPGSPVTLSSRPENGSLILEVTDHGPGLSTEQIRKIGAHLQFDRKLREQQGSGLGLAICRRISELNGGSLNLTSVPGTQTRVTVSLPA